jgi:putative aminopeptidase FrvX
VDTGVPADSDHHAHTYADRQPHAHQHADAYRHADGHSDPYSNLHPDEEADTDAEHHSLPDLHYEADGDRISDGDHGRDARRIDLCTDATPSGLVSLGRREETCMEVVHLLRQLSEITGLSGHEEPARQWLWQTWEPLVDELRRDALGSLIALKRATSSEASDGPTPKLMLAAHMDEIGLIVTGIDKGFLRIHRVGGTDNRVLLGCEVLVHGKRELLGVVATRPPHVVPKKDRDKVVPWDKLFVDVGLPAEQVEKLVKVGDLVSIRRELSVLENDRVAGKALDDRASIAVLTLTLERLAEMQHRWDVFAVATAQEETGLKGATTAAYGIAPDLGIALDVTFGSQPGVSEAETDPLGEGPSIGVGPNFHPGLVARLKEVAEAEEIPFQLDPCPGRSGTDAWALQVTREGVPTALISVPIRYMHQPVELLETADVERAARLLAALIATLEVDSLESLSLNGASSSGDADR